MVRDEQVWYQSVCMHIGDFVVSIHEWIYGKGYGLPKYHEQHTLAVFQTHQENVKQYFADQPHRLLTIDTQRDLNWEILCDFLECPIPDIPFPHLNQTYQQAPLSQAKRCNRIKSLRRSFKNRLLLAYLNGRKLL